jgi:hypothetical protein
MRPVRVAKRAAAVALSAGVALVAVELGYRGWLFGWASFSRAQMNSLARIGVSGLLAAATTPGVVFELKPNLRTFYKLVPFETNAQGLRDREYSIAKPPHTFRTVVLGDSFTMPSGVRIEDAYHTLLEDRLNREGHGGVTYEFVNFGVGGYSLDQYWAVLDGKARRYAPDLVVVGFCPFNDFDALPAEALRQPYRPKPQVRPFYRSFFLREIWDRAGWLKTNGRHGEYRPYTDDEVAHIATVFERFETFSRVDGVPVLIAYLTHVADSRIAANSARVEALAQAKGLHFVDTSPDFALMAVKDVKVMPIDGHPNAAANRIFAAEIYQYLVSARLLPVAGEPS